MHVLPQFTFLEIVASVGGVLFIFYIIGNMIFPVCARFYLENSMMSQLYKDAVEIDEPKLMRTKRSKAPWGQIKSGKVGIFDF